MAPTLFHEMWWLDVSSRGTIEQVSVKRDGVCVANMFFTRRKTLGVRQIRMPPYTRTLGPTFLLPSSKVSTRLMNIRRLTGELVDKLPPYDRLFHTLPPFSESAFAFSLNGFGLEPNYTFRVGQDVTVANIWTGLDQKLRNSIRSAKQKWSVCLHYDLDRFQRLALTNHPGNLNDFESLRRIFAACVARGRTVILAAEDEHGRDCAMAILVWGTDTAYYWLSARDPATATGGTNSLLIWHSIIFAKERNLTFDFDGFGNRGAWLFLEQFGLEPVPRPNVLYENTKGRLFGVARGALQAAVHAGSGTGRWPVARLAARAASSVFDMGRNGIA